MRIPVLAVIDALGPEPARCRWCATWVSRLGTPSHAAVLACEAPSCQREAEAYAAALARRRAA